MGWVRVGLIKKVTCMAATHAWPAEDIDRGQQETRQDVYFGGFGGVLGYDELAAPGDACSIHRHHTRLLRPSLHGLPAAMQPIRQAGPDVQKKVPRCEE